MLLMLLMLMLMRISHMRIGQGICVSLVSTGEGGRGGRGGGGIDVCHGICGKRTRDLKVRD